MIPVYNVEKYLSHCLDSVLNQTFQDWEAICVDDGSADRSSIILDKYAERDGRVKVLKQKNAGTASARNAGLKAAKGDYIFFLDSDDWLVPNALQTLSNHLNEEDILCFSGCRYFESFKSFNQADHLLPRHYKTGIEYYNENALLPRDFAFVCVVLRIYRRAFLLQNDLFFADDISYEDNLWVPIVLYYAESVSVIPDSLYIYRIREGSKMQDVSLKRKVDLLKVANRLAEFFVPKNGFDKATVYRAITHHYQVVFTQATPEDDKKLIPLLNWESYKIVSGTKPRHRLYFAAMRISPRLYRTILKFIK